jgi:hypothetical protein
MSAHAPLFGRPSAPPAEIPLVRFLCLPSSIQTIRQDCFREWKYFVHLVFESNSDISSFVPKMFCGCISLRSIQIPASIPTIPAKCFEGCRALSTVTFEGGGSVSALGEDAFFHCSSLQSLWIPASVESIDDRCGVCFVLFEVSSRLSTLGIGVFDTCEHLRSIYIPASVSRMTGWTFAGCVTRNIEIDPVNRFFRSDEHFIFDVRRNALVRYLRGSEEVFIGKEFETIDAICFEWRGDISTVQFEAGSRISSLGVAAFFSASGWNRFALFARLKRFAIVVSISATNCKRLSSTAAAEFP